VRPLRPQSARTDVDGPDGRRPRPPVDRRAPRHGDHAQGVGVPILGPGVEQLLAVPQNLRHQVHHPQTRQRERHRTCETLHVTTVGAARAHEPHPPRACRGHDRVDHALTRDPSGPCGRRLRRRQRVSRPSGASSAVIAKVRWSAQ